MAVTNARKAVVGSDNCVNCPTCSYEILLLNGQKPTKEFSVLCPNCGERSFHQLTGIHDHRLNPDSAKISARVPFGMRAANSYNRIMVDLEQPKSRMREFASWLLK
jgi:hypothetical protein